MPTDECSKVNLVLRFRIGLRPASVHHYRHKPSIDDRSKTVSRGLTRTEDFTLDYFDLFSSQEPTNLTCSSSNNAIETSASTYIIG